MDRDCVLRGFDAVRAEMLNQDVRTEAVKVLESFERYFKNHLDLLDEIGDPILQRAFLKCTEERLTQLRKAMKQQSDRRRKKYMSKRCIKQLRAWFKTNEAHPYPSDDQKKIFCNDLDVSMKQITTWFINERNRKWDRSKHNSMKYNSLKYKRKKINQSFNLM